MKSASNSYQFSWENVLNVKSANQSNKLFWHWNNAGMLRLPAIKCRLAAKLNIGAQGVSYYTVQRPPHTVTHAHMHALCNKWDYKLQRVYISLSTNFVICDSSLYPLRSSSFATRLPEYGHSENVLKVSSRFPKGICWARLLLLFPPVVNLVQ